MQRVCSQDWNFLRCVNQDMENTRIAGRTVVIGGGNVAVDVARTALRAGASSVSMYCLETRETMPAAGDEIEEAAQEASVSVIPGARRKSLRKTAG